MYGLPEGVDVWSQTQKTNVNFPLERNDHPEIDVTEPLDTDGIQMYQS